MGDLNVSAMCAQPIKTCVRYRLGGNNAGVRNKIHKYDQHLSKLWRPQSHRTLKAYVQKANVYGLPLELQSK